MTKDYFLGGMDNQFSTEKADFDKTYALLVNGRVRNNNVEPVALPVDLTLDLPVGKKQGIYVYDKFLLAFITGRAYVKEYTSASSSNPWVPIVGLQMSATVEKIYVELLPGSTVNFVRTGKYAVLDFGAPISASPSCLICCDGETQNWLITPDGNARKIGLWADWTTDRREYVPIGICPMFLGTKLYIMCKDLQGRFTQICQSVSGRPLDFVLLVNDVGGKAGATEKEFGAPALAYSVSFDSVTALARIPASGDAFLVTTERASFMVQQNFDKLIAGEPTHNNQFLFAVGAFGPEAIGDLNGDTAVVFPGGIRSFNSVSTAKWEGRNAPLNRSIQNLTSGRVQTTGAVGYFDNYVGFAVNTRYGHGIVWWDGTLGVFVALDIYPGVGAIKQFATLLVPGDARIFARDDADQVFELFRGGASETSFTLHDINAGVADGSVAIRNVVAAFNLSDTASCWTTYCVADGRITTGPVLGVGYTDAVTDTISIPTTPGVAVPNAEFSVSSINSAEAHRNTLTLRWTGGAVLSRIAIDAEVTVGRNTENTTALTYTPEKVVFIANDGLINDDRTAVNLAIKSIKDLNMVVGAGDHVYNSGSRAELLTNLVPYWDDLHSRGRFIAVHGNHDYETNNGEPLWSYLQQPPARSCSYKIGDHTEVFLYDTGIKTDGTQINIANLDGATPDVSTQANKLVNAIRASAARNKIVVWHQTPYTSSDRYVASGGAELAQVAALQRLAMRIEDVGATALICGHAHLYERIHLGNLTIFTVGTGGAALAGTGTILPNSARRVYAHGYLNATFTALTAEFSFVDGSGNVLDRWIS